MSVRHWETEGFSGSVVGSATRSPADVWRLVMAVAATVGMLAAVALLDDLIVGAGVDAVDLGRLVGDVAVVGSVHVVRGLATIGAAGAVAWLGWSRQWRWFALVFVGTALAAVAVPGVVSGLVGRLESASIAVPSGGWLCSVPVSGPCVAAPLVPGWLAAGVAGSFGVIHPALSIRWRRAGWWLLALLGTVSLLDATLVPGELWVVLAAGYGVGAATDLAAGTPERLPAAEDLAAVLSSREGPVVEITSVDVPARSSTPLLARMADGTERFVKLVGPSERAADLLFRAYRALRFKGALGDGWPETDLRRSVEREAAASLQAANAGVLTPRMRTVAAVGDSVMLVFDAVAAEPLSRRPGPGLSRSLLDGVWDELATLHRAGMAHGNLGPNSVLVDGDDRPWLVDFGRAEVDAEAGTQRRDVADLMATLAAVGDVDAVVAAAVRAVGADRVVAAAPLLQSHALSSSTRQSVDDGDHVLERLRGAVAGVAGIDGVALEPLERVRPATLLTALMLGLAVYLLLPQLAKVDVDAIAGADWSLAPAILVFSALTYVAAAVALMGAVPERLRAAETVLAQVASSFFNRIVPAKVGGMAANVRYLQKAGVDPAVAVAGVGVNNLAGVVMHVVLTAAFLTAAGRSGTNSLSLPSGQSLLAGLVIAFTVAGLVMVLPWGRAVFLKRVWPIVKKAGAGVASLVESPRRMAMLFGGAASISLAYVMALWFSLEAFGGGTEFVSVAAVFFAGTAVAQAAPTPGGIGAAEAALIAGLTAFGTDAAVAVPGVLLYRTATFWLPVAPGWLAYRVLARRGRL